MAVEDYLADSVLRDIGSLHLSCVRTDNPMAVLRAAHLRNALTRVGLHVPFWAAHDIGLLAVLDPSTIPIEPRPGALSSGLSWEATEALKEYALTLEELRASEVLERARQFRLSDELIAVILLRVLGPIFERHRPGLRESTVFLPLDPEVYRDLEPRLSGLYHRFDRSDDELLLRRMASERLRVITQIEQIDVDTLRLLGMFGAEAGAASALDMLDLLSVFETPQANDVANFSLDLLPSVLETRRASGEQRFSVDGYAGIARRGTLDSLVLTELAFDPELFDRRYVENEVFYYSHEKEHDEERRIHYVVIDASASMRGQRSVFARGLALTLIKKLALKGEDVYLRFFDSRLYDLMRIRSQRGNAAGLNVPYVLCFKGEHGRNYARVFSALVNEMQKLKRRERTEPILYILTHAECHVPVPIIERLATQARLYGVFMLPSTGELELEYLPKLHTVQIVAELALNQREVRARRALDIVEDAASERVSEAG